MPSKDEADATGSKGVRWGPRCCSACADRGRQQEAARSEVITLFWVMFPIRSTKFAPRFENEITSTWSPLPHFANECDLAALKSDRLATVGRGRPNWATTPRRAPAFDRKPPNSISVRDCHGPLAIPMSAAQRRNCGVPRRHALAGRGKFCVRRRVLAAGRSPDAIGSAGRPSCRDPHRANSAGILSMFTHFRLPYGGYTIPNPAHRNAAPQPLR
jgi:hypothetical protein